MSDPAVVDRIKQDILAMEDGSTFAEIQNDVEGFCGGDYNLLLRPNLYLWSGLTEDGYNAIRQLLMEKVVWVRGCSWVEYSFAGHALDLPIAKRVPESGYKQPRWLPCVIERDAEGGSRD